MVETKKLSTLFIGIVLIGTGILVLEMPELIRYWVAAAFFLSGLSYFIRVIQE